jgi:hypothetical protein
MANICTLLIREEDFLAAPKLTYATPDELAATAGTLIDLHSR